MPVCMPSNFPFLAGDIIKKYEAIYKEDQQRTNLFLFLDCDNIMNITINNPSKIPKAHLAPLKDSHYTRISQLSSPNSPSNHCAGFFSNCMGGQQPVDSAHELSQEIYPHQLHPPSSPTPKAQSGLQNSRRKRKISVSLSRKHSLQYTPSKDEAMNKQRYASEHKKIKTEYENLNASRHPLPAEQGKIKTEPKKQKASDEGLHHLKQSRKPSTQVGSAHSAKKSSDSAKPKLTLSSAFKSQMQQSQMQQLPQQIPLPPSQDLPSSVQIEESFMTAKLANIYMGSELQIYTNSNIVYYNQLMANEKAWRGEGERERAKGEISIQNIPEEQLPEEEAIVSRFKERRWIGEYAKTIKTFNQSELRSNQLNSEAESIVLEKGHSQFSTRPIMPVNRGSIKQCREQGGERLKRAYGSVGEELGTLSVTYQNRFKKITSPTIVEDLHDSDHNCDRE